MHIQVCFGLCAQMYGGSRELGPPLCEQSDVCRQRSTAFKGRAQQSGPG